MRFISFINEIASDVAQALTSKERFKAFFRVSLYRNAIYLMSANALASLAGFVFWIIVARFYTAEDVGLASAAISAVMLLVSFSHLGLGHGLIRFLPHAGKDASSMINSCFNTSALISILVSVIFIAGLGLWSPALLFLRQNPVYLAAFIAFTMTATLSEMMNYTFVARRQAGFVLARRLITGLLRLPLPVLLAAFFHSFGIFVSWAASMAVALVASLFLFLPRAQPGYHPAFAVRKEAGAARLSPGFCRQKRGNE